MARDDVQLGTRVPPEVVDRINSVAHALNMTKRDAVIMLVGRGYQLLSAEQRSAAEQLYEVLHNARRERPGVDAPTIDSQ